MVLHGALGVTLVAWGSDVRVAPAKEVTSGSWAGTIFEVGLSSTEGVEGARAVAGTAEAVAAAERPPADEVELEAGKEEAPAAAPEQSHPAEKKVEEDRAPSTPNPSVEARGAVAPSPSPNERKPAVASQEVQRPTNGRQAAWLGEAQGKTSGGPATDAARGSAEGGETVGLGGERAAARLGQLPAAWTRALPAAARGDATWHELEPGLVGRWVVLAKLDERGALTSLQVESGSRPFVERLLRVSQALLRAGRFALPPGSSGEHRLGLEVRIDRGGEASRDGAPHLVRQLASRYPTTEEPGEALVVFNSGRRVQLRVYLEPHW